MKSLVIYDSLFGNTEKIARAVAQTISPDTIMMRVQEMNIGMLSEADLIVFGSPTHGGQATPAMLSFMQSIPIDVCRGKNMAVFDTGIPAAGQKVFLKMLIQILGYASRRMAKTLSAKGAIIRGTPTTFMVVDKNGPLVEGELERARKWAATLI